MDNLRVDWQANLIKNPKYTWRCRLIHGTWWMVEEGKQPNWFHRKMQELCFGFKWEKYDG